MKTFIWSLIFLAVAAQAANKGHDAGNGGYTVTCDKAEPNGKTQEVLDYHELRYKYDPGYFVVDLGGQGTEWDRVHYALDRLKRLDPKRAADYQDKASHFEENALHVAHVSLPDAKDLGRVYMADDCKTVQAVVQYQQPLPGQRKYAVSDTVYQALSLDDRAGLILHEIIYGEALAHGATNSVDARYLNALISSKQIESLSNDEYDARLQAINFEPTHPIHQHHAPIWIAANPTLPNAIANTLYMRDISSFVMNPDGTALSFSKTWGPAWLTVTADGKLAGTPSVSDIGDNNFMITVTNLTGESADATVHVVVVRDHMLGWNSNPVDIGTFEPGKMVSLSLAPYVSNPNQAMLTFSMGGFPMWAHLSPDGILTGVPSKDDVGIASFPVTVSDGNLSTQTTVRVTISKLFNPLTLSAKVNTRFHADLKSWITLRDGVFELVSIEPQDAWVLAADGQLSGTPGIAGNVTLRVRVHNAKGELVEGTLTIYVSLY